MLVATYPSCRDETQRSKTPFGAGSIEYDIVHVCRKRLAEPEPVSRAKMRRYVRDEAARLKKLIEGTHGRELPESNLRIILIGMALELYSRTLWPGAQPMAVVTISGPVISTTIDLV